MKLGAAGMVVLAMGCAHPAAPPIAHAQHVATERRFPLDDPPPWRPARPRSPFHRRPVLDVPVALVSSNLVTWPLHTPPAMRPHLDLGHAPRAGCQRASTTFADSYAAAWCSILTGDRARGAAELVPLARAARGQEQDALLFDLGEVIADLSPALDALRWLQTSSLPAAMWDVLIATYIENSDPKTARFLVTARPPMPADCHREIRDALLLSQRYTLNGMLATTTDETCRDQLLELRCEDALAGLYDSEPLDAASHATHGSCTAYLARHPDQAPRVHLSFAYHQWPGDMAHWDDWTRTVDYAVLALGEPGADQLAIDALENAGAIADCSVTAIGMIRALANTLAASPALAAELRPRAAALAQFAPTCPGAP